ncbi:MAG TPA: hypothetical protein VG028_13250 [Terriglobia bacterium]|nr:hypothetical protein [Terriglobia bacterium]
MIAAIAKAAIPEPYRIFGLQLLPFSLGRYRRMQRFGCAFVAEEESTATFQDLVLGLAVCSQRCQEFDEWLQSKSCAKDLARWGRRIRREIAAEEHFNLYGKYELFKRYLDEASDMPKYWDESETQPISGAHWSHSVEVALRGELGYTAEEINENPLQKSLADYFKWAESQGLVRLMTPEEIAYVESGQAQMTVTPAPKASATQEEVFNGS